VPRVRLVAIMGTAKSKTQSTLRRNTASIIKGEPNLSKKKNVSASGATDMRNVQQKNMIKKSQLISLFIVL